MAGMRIIAYYLLTAVILLTACPTIAENSKKKPPASASNLSEIVILSKTLDTLAIQERIQHYLDALHQQGYLDATIDSIHQREEHLLAFIQKGPQYQWILRAENLEPELVNKLRISSSFAGDPISFDRFRLLCTKILEDQQNNGYPFAQLKTVDIRVQDNLIFAGLHLEPFHAVVFDSLQIFGDVKLNRNYLEQHLGIASGAPYNQQRIDQIASRLGRLGFTELNGEPQLQFSPAGATIGLPLKAIRANRFDGIAGLYSDTQQNPDRIRLTGSLNLLLLNALHRAEQMELFWQSQGEGTQSLHVKLDYPYAFQMPVMTGMAFQLHRQDSSWVQVNYAPTLGFELTEKLFMRLKGTFTRNTLLNIPATSQDPFLAGMDYQLALYALETEYYSQDWQGSFTRKGYHIALEAGAGNRRIRQNTRFEPAVYEQLTVSTLQMRFSLAAEWIRPVGLQSSFSSLVKAAHWQGKQLVNNQVFRLGGFNSLRGFDQDALLASSYFISRVEYRLFTAEKSYFSLFANGGWIELRAQGRTHQDWPWGLGAGMSLETRPGLLSVYYALGAQENAPLQFRRAKIHIGLTSLF